MKDVEKANHYIEKGVPVITTNSEVLIQSNVDAIPESTGNPEIAARHAYNAINNSKTS